MVNGRELAQQMSHVESRFYCKILPKECLGWNRKDKDTVCKNIWFVSFIFAHYGERERKREGKKGENGKQFSIKNDLKTIFIKK